MFKGTLFALFAAFFNALIGVISVGLMDTGLSYDEISFYKCLIAFISLSLIIILKKDFFKWVNFVVKSSYKLAICAFFGLFILYF